MEAKESRRTSQGNADVETEESDETNDNRSVTINVGGEMIDYKLTAWNMIERGRSIIHENDYRIEY